MARANAEPARTYHHFMVRSVAHHPHPAPAPTLVRGEMKYWLLKPDARLRDAVRSYFIVEAEPRRAPKYELHLPDGYSELVFTFRDPFERAPLGEAFDASLEGTPMRRSYLIGARSRSIVTRDLGNFRVIGVKLEPRMLRALVRVPLSEFRDSAIELRELNHSRLLQLESQLSETSSPQQAAAILDTFFVEQMRNDAPARTIVDQIMERIRACRGARTIADCTQDMTIAPRTLERAFAADIGMTPKKYARIVRFKHAYHALLTQIAPSGSRARVSAESYLDAYCDQSHFYKDFRFFTGTSPATLLAMRTPASTDVTNLLVENDLAAA